jgi:hypothetical protein
MSSSARSAHRECGMQRFPAHVGRIYDTASLSSVQSLHRDRIVSIQGLKFLRTGILLGSCMSHKAAADVHVNSLAANLATKVFQNSSACASRQKHDERVTILVANIMMLYVIWKTFNILWYVGVRFQFQVVRPQGERYLIGAGPRKQLEKLRSRVG